MCLTRLQPAQDILQAKRSAAPAEDDSSRDANAKRMLPEDFESEPLPLPCTPVIRPGRCCSWVDCREHPLALQA